MFEIIVVILLLFIAIEIKLYNNKKYLKTMHSIVLLIFVREKKMTGKKIKKKKIRFFQTCCTFLTIISFVLLTSLSDERRNFEKPCSINHVLF